MHTRFYLLILTKLTRCKLVERLASRILSRVVEHNIVTEDKETGEVLFTYNYEHEFSFLVFRFSRY